MAWTDPATVTVGTVAPAALWNTHVRDNLNALGRDVADLRNVGTAGGLGERWYPAGVAGQAMVAGVSTQLLTVNEFLCVPLIAPRSATIDRIGFEVTTAGAAGSVVRPGIYKSTSDTNLYPNALVVDGGEISTTTTGVKTATISVAPEPDALYWAVLLNGVAAPTVKSTGGNFPMLPVIGMSATFTQLNGGGAFTRTQTYGALPDPFPAGPPTSFNVSNVAFIGLRYA